MIKKFESFKSLLDIHSYLKTEIFSKLPRDYKSHWYSKRVC